ncbi:cyclin-domain-containing protein [Gymnopilus junonius]|uniref:Cyclin-domain-containing protein n=1 Tax=Gymnopilus junonius TaxID=109634 RepID=A0A9P5NM00_GYMJU|nr:cyclin-domain-containing protein [Gymnopilus junonius]
MLAVVQPYSASPDGVHRGSASRSAASSSSSSRSANLAQNHAPPTLQRHQTAPPAAPSSSFRRTPTPPPSTKPVPSPPSDPEPSPSPALDIHSYPATDLLKLLALLLTHIATTNDHLSPTNSNSSQQNYTPIDPADAPPIFHSLTTASRNAISTPAATLTFHARNIPTISLEAYLLRILKYCPTTNHVFLSLLVYFDRMSKLSEDAVGRPFVIDSYNIHRLVIAGVTVASKFFSDVFYTNSRYAKVCFLLLTLLVYWNSRARDQYARGVDVIFISFFFSQNTSPILRPTDYLSLCIDVGRRSATPGA